jgi:hypothetical protein
MRSFIDIYDIYPMVTLVIRNRLMYIHKDTLGSVLRIVQSNADNVQPVPSHRRRFTPYSIREYTLVIFSASTKLWMVSDQ